MAVTRRVHVFETGQLSDSSWWANKLQTEMAAKLGQHERIVDMRWPTTSSGTLCVWVTTEELVMGPGNGAQGK